MKQFIVAALIVVSFVSLLPLQAQAITLVPCGTSAHQPPRDAQGRLQLPAGKTLADYPHADCQLGHLFVLIIRTINYLISMAALVAMYFIVTAGFGMVTALGNAEKIQSSKESISHAVIGFAIIMMAFVFVNLLINGILGDTTKGTRQWWEPGCLYDITNIRNECPQLRFLGPMAQQAAIPGTAVAGGTCSGVQCSDSALNICSPVAPGDGCYESAVNRWNNQIVQGVGSNTQIASGIDAVKMLKAIMARESNGVEGKTSRSDPPSLGLFQLKVGTANSFKAGCTTANIDEAWLLSENNATAQACIAAAYLRSLVGVCGSDVRQLAAGYNGGAGACAVSEDCGPSAGSGQCSVCQNQNRATRRWECLWDDSAHQQCNANRAGNFSETRRYAPQVEYCYARFNSSSAATAPAASNETDVETAIVPADTDNGVPPGIQVWSGEDPLGLIWGSRETELKAALSAFGTKWGSQLTARQAFRPIEYTNHIRSIWEAWRLQNNDGNGAGSGYACSGAKFLTKAIVDKYTAAQKSWISAEASKHAFQANGTPPACQSDHESGIAMDVYPVPSDFSTTKAEYSRWIKAGFDSGLCHNIAGDEPHFILRAGSGLSDQQCLTDYVAPVTSSSSGAAPANIRLSPATALAGTFDKLVNSEAAFKNNNLTLTITGQNLEGAVITSNAADISGGTGLIVTAVRMISDTATDDKVEADLSIAPGTRDGQIIFAIRNKHGKTITTNFNIQLTGTQWLQRHFPKTQKRITFFGHWSEIAPNERGQNLMDQINKGKQFTSSDQYKKLDIWMNVWEQSLWDKVKTSVCSTELAAGCAGWRDNIIDVSESSDTAGIVLHESAHKLHAYYGGIYYKLNPLASSFPTKWVSAVGNISNCPYLPLKDVSHWKDGTWDTAHCGFIRAYGASDTLDSAVIKSLCNFMDGSCYAEDIATMTEEAVFQRSKFNDSEIRSDLRYKQKLNLLLQYEFISNSPLGMNGPAAVWLTQLPEFAIFSRSKWTLGGDNE